MKTTTRILAATFIIGISMLSAAMAQPKTQQPVSSGLTVRKLPPNMNETQFRQRISALLAKNKAEAKAQAQQTAIDAKKIFDAMSSERSKVSSALNSDTRYKAFMDEARRISSSKGTNDEKATQLKTLAQQNQGMFREVIGKAGIDRNAMQSKLQKIMPGVTVMPDFTVKKLSTTKRASSAGTLAVTPSMQEIVLRPPFTYEEYDSENQGIAYSDASATPNADDGRAKSKVTVVGVAGEGTADAQFGEYITVPAGVKRVEVIVKAKTDYSGNALGVIGAGSAFAYVQVFMQNTASDANQFDAEAKYEGAHAPIAWYAEMEGGETSEYRFSFNVPNNDREYLIAGSAYASAVAAGVPGYAHTTAKTEIDKITVRYHFQ
jgi:hypothetical protein